MTNRSSFIAPNYTPDVFAELFDLPPSQLANAQEYQQLKLTPNKTQQQQERLNQLTTTLQNFLISPERWNHFTDALSSMQWFLKNEVEGYIDIKQQEFQAEIDKFNNAGDYSPSATYQRNNFVRHIGEIYIALKTNLNITPSDNGIDWRKLSIKGDRGEKGDDGVDLVYKRTFNPTLNYVVNDVVTYNGSAYACILNAPPGKYPDGIDGATYWTLFVSGGGGVGNLSSLTTTAKNDLVSAVNEVNSLTVSVGSTPPTHTNVWIDTN